MNFSHVDEKIIKELALMIALNCVSNTTTEEYHSQGSLSAQDIKKFNAEVTNKIYTFLWFMFNGSQSEKTALLEVVKWTYPDKWDRPVMDEDIVKAVKVILGK
jgi:hypothetical protein